MKLILSLVLVVLLVITGCAMFAGVEQSLSEMSDVQFYSLEQQIYLISNAGFTRLFNKRPEMKETMASLIEVVSPYVDEYSPNTALIITELVDTVLLKIDDPDAKFIIQLALLEIQKYGGLNYLDTAKVGAYEWRTNVLDMRSVKLVQAVFKGMIEAING